MPENRVRACAAMTGETRGHCVAMWLLHDPVPDRLTPAEPPRSCRCRCGPRHRSPPGSGLPCGRNVPILRLAASMWRLPGMLVHISVFQKQQTTSARCTSCCLISPAACGRSAVCASLPETWRRGRVELGGGALAEVTLREQVALPMSYHWEHAVGGTTGSWNGVLQVDHASRCRGATQREGCP